jgi:hypothetical protein
MNSSLSRVQVEVELGASKQTKKTSFIAFYQFKFLSFLFCAGELEEEAKQRRKKRRRRQKSDEMELELVVGR